MYVWVSGPSLLPLPSLLNELLFMCRSPPKGQNQPYVSAKNFSGPTTPTYTYLYMPDTDDVTLRNSFTSKQLLHICLTHLSLGTYVHTFLFFSTMVTSSIPFNCYLHHSLAQTQTQTQKLRAKIPYHTLPTQNFK